MATGEPTLIINPRGDQDFVALVEREFRAGPTSAAAFQAQLRTEYPLASVRERGLAGEARATWYVYREGRWIPSAT
jgi:hypothetical protein